jgi:hypothetical protein
MAERDPQDGPDDHDLQREDRGGNAIFERHLP